MQKESINAKQPSGIVPGGDQSGAPSASSELGQPSGEPSAPVNAGLDGVGGDVVPAIVPAADQQPTLKGEPSVPETIETIKTEEKGQEKAAPPAIDEELNEAALQAELEAELAGIGE